MTVSRFDRPKGVAVATHRPRFIKDTVGRWVRTRVDIETIGKQRIPSGSICTIKRFGKGGATLEFKCECCGSWTTIPKIPDSYFQFVIFCAELPKDKS